MIKRYGFVYIDFDRNKRESVVYNNNVNSAIKFFREWKGNVKIITIDETLENQLHPKTRILNTAETGEY